MQLRFSAKAQLQTLDMQKRDAPWQWGLTPALFEQLVL